MQSLTKMVAEMQAAGMEPGEARMTAMEVVGDREQTLAEETAKAEWKQSVEFPCGGTHTHHWPTAAGDTCRRCGAPLTAVPEYVPTSADGIRRALTVGGRAVVSVRSHKSGEHVTVVLVARKKKVDGKGWIARTSAAGRVGMTDADCVEARDPDREYPDNYVGRLYTDGPTWRAGKDADRLRAWTAEKVLSYALGGYPLDHQADVFIATTCCTCGKQLTDPVSVERGQGPECYGKTTGSKMAAHQVSA